jgi:hypothetical protein
MGPFYGVADPPDRVTAKAEVPGKKTSERCYMRESRKNAVKNELFAR